MFGIIPQRLENILRQPINTNYQQTLTTWLVNSQGICKISLSDKCTAVVDGSFFPETPEYISAHWKFIYERKIIG